MKHRRPIETRVVFPWQRRSVVLDWLTSRRRRSLVWLGVLGLVMAGLLRVEDHRRRTLATRAALTSVRGAVAAFRADHGRCPSGMEELVRPPTDGARPGPYLVDARMDGWGRPLRITCPGRNPGGAADVESGGASGTLEDLYRID